MNDNKLIAEFMKLECEEERFPKEGNLYWIGDDWVNTWHMKYHSSWDWLMPVIIKISSLTEDGIKIEDYETIQSAYHFVVEFIKANKYPFNEGDDYWVEEDGDLVWGVWDDASEDMHDENPNRQYFTEEEVIDHIKTYGVKLYKQ